MQRSPAARLAALAFTLACALFAPVAGAAITLVGSTNNVSATVSSGGVGSMSLPPSDTQPLTGVPGTATANAALFGNSASITGTLSHSAFVFNFTHGTANAFSSTSAHVQFKSDVDVTYTLSGSFTASGEPFFQTFAGTLAQVAPPATLFNNSQSGFTTNGGPTTFTLGQQTGNIANALSGSLTGTLAAGVTYDLTFSATLESEVDPSGTGGVTLAFAPIPTNGNIIPLPPAVWAGLVAGAGVLARRRFAR
ncbi:MAG: hypothetical protein ACAI43_13935 [Phycisphaerae bacterium]